MGVRNRRSMTIVPHEEGLSLVEWLARRYTYRDRAGWCAEIAGGRILVDLERAEPELLLRRGMSISYDPPPVPEPPVDTGYRIVHRDDELLVVDKPGDLPSHPGGIYLENSLVTLLKREYGEVYLANRLDRETSGLMLVARSKAMATWLFGELRERRVVKEYRALVHGRFPDYLDAVGWLVRDEASRIRKKRAFLPDAAAVDPGDAGSPGRQFCRTEFRREESDGVYSLLRCRLHTGKTHQIRATLRSLGYPLVGDKIYGLDDEIFLRFASGKMTEGDRKLLVLPSQALQSAMVAFRTGPDAAVREFRAPLPGWAELLGSKEKKL